MPGRGMRRTGAVLAALMVTASLVGCTPQEPPAEVKARASVYTNPVYRNIAGEPKEASDPMAVKYNGEYYVYVTGNQCGLLKSKDLVHWEWVGTVLGDGPSCWAPDVVYRNGVFYAYASTLKFGEAEKGRRVRLFTSESPTGPFQYVADVTDHYSYDGHYFEDEDGTAYLYWTRECGLSGVYPCSGNPTLVDRLEGMTRLAGQTTRVATPFDWECGGRCIFEAPQVLRRDGLYYMLYSGGAYENEHYGMGYARSSVPMGPDGLEDMTWEKVAQILRSVPDQVSGPGGGSWVKAPNNLDDWVIYHGRVGNSRGGVGRWLRIDPVVWGTDRFWLPGAPSTTEQVGPALPAFRDLFDRADQEGLGPDWETRGGEWSVVNEEGLQRSAEGRAEALTQTVPETYLFEANLKLLAGSGKMGIYAVYAGENDYAAVWFDPNSRSLVLEQVADGSAREAVYTLPEDFRFDVYHQLLVTRNHSDLSIRLDGRPVLTGVIPALADARVGLVTEGAGASFDGIAITHGWEDFFDTPSLAGWGSAADDSPVAGEWAVQEGRLVQGKLPGRQRIFKGDPTWGSYAVTVTAQWLSVGEGRRPRYGLYAAYEDDRNYAELLIDPTAPALLSHAVVRGKEQDWQTVPLGEFFPDGWNPDEPHTLHVVKNGFSLRVFLDGVLIHEREVPLVRGQPGLLTQDARVWFDSLRVVRWD